MRKPVSVAWPSALLGGRRQEAKSPAGQRTLSASPPVRGDPCKGETRGRCAAPAQWGIA